MKFTDIKQVKPHPAYWINLCTFQRLTNDDISPMCENMGITEDDFYDNIHFICENYSPFEHKKEIEEHPWTDLEQGTIKNDW